MPDRTCITHFLTLGGLAAFISLGRTLSASRQTTFRITVGRMMVSFGLGCSAAFLSFFVPDVPLSVQVGLASALSTLGTDVVTNIVKYKLGDKLERTT